MSLVRLFYSNTPSPPPTTNPGDGSGDGGSGDGGTGGDTGEDVGTILQVAGVGSESSTAYPRTPSTTTGHLYVDPVNGADGNTGKTIDAAFETLDAALDAVQDNQRILVRGGRIVLTTRIFRDATWLAGIEVWNYGTETPILDGSSLPAGASEGRILQLAGQREHWKGFRLEHCDSYDAAVYIEGQHNTIDAFESTDGPRGAISVFGGSNNLLKDCYVHHLGDPSEAGDTNVPDGYQLTLGAHDNTLVRCVAERTPDDGFDCFYGRDNLFLDCVAIESGYFGDGTPGNTNYGDGMGFKAGGGDGSNSGRNEFYGCISIDSRMFGFARNGAPLGGVKFIACTSIDAGKTGWDAHGLTMSRDYACGYQLGGDASGIEVRNSISHGHVVAAYEGAATMSHNTWDLAIGTPGFCDADAGDYSLDEHSPCVGAGSDGGNLGASVAALNAAYRIRNNEAPGSEGDEGSDVVTPSSWSGRVATDRDDATYVYGAGDWFEWDGALYGAYDGGTAVMVRFAVDVPQGALVSSASLTFTVGAEQTLSNVAYQVGAEGVDDAPQLATDGSDFLARRANQVGVGTVTKDGTFAWGATMTFDATQAVQAVVNRAGWVSGNAIHLIIEIPDGTSVSGGSTLQWRSVATQTQPSDVPLLEVEYQE